ncbi:MAG: hypothetical protein ACREP8_06715, partial [Candidatus Binatia bacterium]
MPHDHLTALRALRSLALQRGVARFTSPAGHLEGEAPRAAGSPATKVVPGAFIPWRNNVTAGGSCGRMRGHERNPERPDRL